MNIFYSNCLFESIKAKLKNWESVSIHVLPGWISPTGRFHFYWKNNQTHKVYDFKYHPDYSKNFGIYFKGFIQEQTEEEWRTYVYRISNLLVKRLQKTYNFKFEDKSVQEVERLEKKLDIVTDELAFRSQPHLITELKSEVFMKDFERFNVSYILPVKIWYDDEGVPMQAPNGSLTNILEYDKLPSGTTHFLVF